MGLNNDLSISLEECQQEIDQHDLDSLNDDECPSSLAPYNGMQFHSKDEAYSFYLMFVESIRLGVSIKASRRSKMSRQFIDVKSVCSRYGGKKERTFVSNRSNKVDCKAMLHVKSDSNGNWYVKNFIKGHNHELCPIEADFLSCHGSISSSSKENIDTLHAVGYENVGHLEKDIRDHLDKEPLLALASRDAKAMLEHFLNMHSKDPNFFYAIDLDEEQRLKNVFWVDAKSREDYKLFGDDVSTFVWLMQTWVRAMGGKSPIAILTDQDKALKAAISIVFPNTQHRFCLWHILTKIPEKLGHVISYNENFMGIFNDCIYNSWLEDDFEKKWKNMIEKFELEGNEWLEQTSLKEFVEQYEVALRDREAKEVHANFNTWHTKPILKSLSPFEKQMSMIHTHEVFKRFQVEVLGAHACFPQREGDIGALKAFKVEDDETNINFIITWDESRQDVRCSCRMFEYYGFLCSHALNVLQVLCISNIPSHLILKQWTRDVRSLESMSHISNGEQSKKQRFDELLHQATKLSEEASSSHESFIIGYSAIKEALKRCQAVNSSLNIPRESQSGLQEVQEKVDVNSSLLCDMSFLDQQVSNKKGSPKRMKSEIDKSDTKEFNTLCAPSTRDQNLPLTVPGQYYHFHPIAIIAESCISIHFDTPPNGRCHLCGWTSA